MLHMTHDKVVAFKQKVELFERLTKKGDTSTFPNLTMLFVI